MAHSFHILKLRLRRTVFVTLLISTLSTTSAVLSYYRDWFDAGSQELSAYDTGLNFWTKDPHQKWAFWAKTPTVSSKVILLAIDDRTLQTMDINDNYRGKFGSWPYSRKIWAHLINYFDKETTAKALVFDFLMSESKAGDKNIQDILENSSIPVYLGFDFNPHGSQLPKVTATNRFPLPKEQKLRSFSTFYQDQKSVDSLLTQKQAAQALAFPIITQNLSLVELPPKEVFDKDGNSQGTQKLWPAPPAKFFWNLFSGFGVVNTEADGGIDAKMRSTRFAYTDGTNSYVTLSMAVAADLLHASSIEIKPGKLTIGSHSFAINQDGSAFIDYGGNFEQRFIAVSLFDVIHEALLLENDREQGIVTPSKFASLFAGKVVVLGASGAGTSDLRSTPFENFAPGMVKHASELDNLLHGQFIIDAPLWISILLSFAISFFSALVILVLQSPRLEVLWPIVQFLIAYFGPGFFLVYFHYHVLSVMPSVAATLASIFATLYDLFWFSKKRDAFQEQFLPFMEESFVHLLAESPHLPSLSSGYQEVTLLTMSVKESQYDLVSFIKSLNSYLLAITPLLMKSEAYLLPESSISITALWGGPFQNNDEAQAKHRPLVACQVALQVLAMMEEVKKPTTDHELPPISMSMGLWQGSVFLANLEIQPRTRFTPVGRESHSVKHLTNLNSFYGTKILLDATLYEIVKNDVIVREIDFVRINGSSSFCIIYELLDIKTIGNSPWEELISLYQQALMLYRKAQFIEVLSLLESSTITTDLPTQLLIKSCKEYIKNPPILPFVGSLHFQENHLYEN